MAVDRHLKRLLRYGVVGITSNLILLLLFAVLIALGWAAVWATITVYIVGVGVTYFFNKEWSFISAAQHSVAVPAYILTYFFGALMSFAIMLFFHNYLGFHAMVVQAVMMLVVAILIFSLLNWLVFRVSGSDVS